MKIKSLFGLAIAGIAFCSCQSDSYKIKGYANGLHNGDTITLALEEYQQKILGQTLVKEGNFIFSGTTDTIVFCRAYKNNDPLTYVSFFLEPGDITIELEPYPHSSRVSGTVLNNEWQELNDSVQMLGSRLILMADKSTKDPNVDRKKLQTAIDSLHRAISDCIINTAHRNKDNVLGKYIKDNYKEPEFK